MEKELKAAIKGLEKDGLIYSKLWNRLVLELIDCLEVSENTEAVTFWKSRNPAWFAGSIPALDINLADVR